MTDVTRIACPGCGTSLRFEPEALDFPASCTACEGRFSAGVYVRVSCPSCHNGSKIRESYRGQHVRCVRCDHNFLADDGIVPGGGGRLLVARMLDTGQLNPPETIQPFLGEARVEVERRLALPIDQRVLEAERSRIEALAERDRLAEEARLFKAIVARMVANPPEPPLPELNPPTDARGSWPDLEPEPDHDDEAIAAIARERDQLELLAQGLKAELDRARLDLEQARIASGETSGQAEGREQATRTNLEQAEALARADRDRQALSSTIDRLNRAVTSAMNGEAEALRRLAEFAEQIEDSDATLVADLDLERHKRQDLAELVERLKAEVEEARQAEAARSGELDRHLEHSEGQRAGLLDQAERARLDLEADHRLETERLTQALEAAERGRIEVAGELEGVRSEREEARGRLEATVASQERLSEAVDRLLEENLALDEDAEKLRLEIRRMAAEAAQARVTPEPEPTPTRTPVVEPKPDLALVEAHRLEKERLEAALELAKTEAERRQKAFVADIRRVKEHYNEILAEKKDLVEKVRELVACREATAEEARPILAAASIDQEREAHRDLAMTLLYGDEPDEGGGN